jgi:RNA polymerase sigma-70 factor (ECF subfamily)
MEKAVTRMDVEAMMPNVAEYTPPTSRKDRGDAVIARTDKGMEEALLIARLKRGDRKAFDEIFRRHVNPVYRQALKLMGNEADAEEVVQEVFLTIYEKAKSFRGTSAFATWAYRITLNKAVGRLRRQKKSETVDLDAYLPRFREDGHHWDRPVVDWSSMVESRLIDAEFQGVVRDAIDQLEALDKAVLLSDLDGFSNREIGEALGLTVQAVKARLHRARLFLRGKLAVHFGYSPT